MWDRPPAWPLMRNNLAREDLDAVIELLRGEDPQLTHGPQVRAFEAEWSQWLGVRHSVFVNSGASANLLSMAALREACGPGEGVVPPCPHFLEGCGGCLLQHVPYAEQLRAKAELLALEYGRPGPIAPS